MKAKLISLCFLLFAGSATAQYFQNTNDFGIDTRTYDGVNVYQGGPGHLIAGTSFITSNEDLVVTRTGFNGLFGGLNTFNNIYRLFDQNGNILKGRPSKILQLPQNGNYFVVGSFVNTATGIPGIYTGIIDLAGNFTNLRARQTLTPVTSTTIFATSACLGSGATANVVYISGVSNATTGNTDNRPFLMAINGLNNALLWMRVYEFGPGAGTQLEPSDLVFSPYQPLPNVNELFVVGTATSALGNTDGFTFRVNVVNGTPVSTALIYDSGRLEEFSAITIATGMGGGGRGFVIAGTTNNTVPPLAPRQAITIKVSQDGTNVRWRTRHDYSTGFDNFGNDIIERLNTIGEWNYYLLASASSGRIGGSDIAVFRLSDVNGTIIDQYTYGFFDTRDDGIEISSFINTPADGITVYGNRVSGAIPGNAEYIIKAYYNGVSGCNEDFFNSNSFPYTFSLTTWQITRTGTASTSNLNANIAVQIGPMNTYCLNTTLPGGSNARIVQPDETSDVNTTVFPNPVSLSNPLLNINLNSPTEQKIEIRITDMLGREVLNQQINITEGQSVQQIQLPSGLSAGVYSMSISGNNVSENHRFVIE